MEQDVKVFHSKITRGVRGESNNLYELLNIEPAIPIRLNEVPKTQCTFQPKSDKHFESKKKSKLKVKSVRDIRNSFENDINIYLPMSLEKQQNILMKRIRDGCSNDEDTKKLATNILKSDNPISRTAWQMLTNINPEGHAHPKQYILWNGKNIRVCGSKGGHDKYIAKYEMRNGRELKHKKTIKKNFVNKKIGLLQNSLSIKFKPGPLTQKKYIDDSYQKYHVGNLELVNLPKPGLDVMPGYGSPMESTIRIFVSSLRDINGIISQQWAEFAVSMLGTVKNANIVQLEPLACTTFDLSYKYDQKKMLMRRDIENVAKSSIDSHERIEKSLLREDDIMEEVTQVMYEIIKSVEINLNQDNMYTGEDEERTVINNDCSSIKLHSNNNCSKEKNKKKFGELDRLHVTVIRLPEQSENTDFKSNMCNNSFCVLGCICESLNCAVIVKGHCGRLECMFKCKCDFVSYKELDNYDNVSLDFMPGLLKLDKEMNLKLAKEEQKFHQTVVLSGDKSILLKPNRRSWKASTKYSDFYKTMSLKSNNIIDRDLVVIDTKISCDYIEPWCMVHNLYKCFCKGRFVNNVGKTEVKHLEVPVTVSTECNKLFNSEPSINSDQPHVTRLQQEQTVTVELRRKERRQSDKSNRISKNGSVIIDLDDPMTFEQSRRTCARVEPYVGRKYSRRYYCHMNKKIRELEKDDARLSKRLKNLIYIEETNANKTSKTIAITSKDSTSKKEYDGKNDVNNLEIGKDDHIVPSKKRKKVVSTEEINKKTYNVSTSSEEMELTSREETPELNADHIRENILCGGFATSGVEDSNKGKLVAWLEYSYKLYKERCQLGITKLTLQAPQPKKMTLLPWNFILERYKDRKNLFLVSKQKPFRMYMAVNRDHPFLQDCLNIDDIRFADLYKYPITVKKLLTNASDLKDSFCILCGHAYCWELIGSVTKVDEPNNKDNLQCDEFVTDDKSLEYNENSCNESEIISSEEDEEKDAKEAEIRYEENISQPDSSKWFIMTIENDFSEIQFFNRGFFVTYDSIIKAINIARYSHKTVRLSSKKCVENSSNSQFGIYAIPNANEDCVFIGPYECHEPLGIKTVKSITLTRKLKRTRGYWITTNKVDNIKVIESPMSFMPDKNIKPNQMLSLKSNPNEKKDRFSSIEHIPEETDEIQTTSTTKNTPTLPKPIKVFKCNSFFPLQPNSLLKLPRNMQQDNIQCKEKAPTVTNVSVTDLLSKLSASKSNTEKDPSLSKPQLDPDSKEADRVHIPDRKNGESKTEGSSFAILKPEEINKRIMNTNIFSKTDDLSNDSKETQFEDLNNPDPEIETDINKFLSTFMVKNLSSPVEDCVKNMDVFVISDEEEDCLNTSSDAVVCDVWIESINIENFGWIPGKRNLLNLNSLSFQFPGFNFSEFYPIDMAFNKLNQVLSRKICIPSSMKLEWRIVSNKHKLKTSKQLQSDDLGSNLILTRKGPRRKLDFLKALSGVKTYSRKPKAAEMANVCEKVEEEIEELE